MRAPAIEASRVPAAQPEALPASRLLTPDQVAGHLEIGRTKVYELIASGAIRSVSIGRARRISVRALEEFVESLELRGST